MRLALIPFLLTVVFPLAHLNSVTFAQGPSPTSRQALVDSIRERGQQDAKAGKTQANAQDLNLLFGKDAEREAVSLREVVDIYDNAYSTAKNSQSFWDSFLPKVGWIAAIIMFLLLIAQEVIKKTVSARLEPVGDRLYRRIAGYRLFQRKSLRKYRKALIEKYRFFQVTFRPNRDLDMTRIYVPLKVKGAGDSEQVDDLGAVHKYKRAMIIGAPGSGKSMLLKRVALLYATASYSGDLVPVFFDLRRLNGADKPVVEHLVDIFAFNKFPGAQNFIISSLEQGKLLLLFDGLDEVNSIKRQLEVDKIIDFLSQYADCNALISCRTAVYKNDFAEASESILEIVEFTDQQIQKFLGSWPNIPEGKSVDELMLTLRERPRIMALARNPLLLTIIAFLYTDMEEFVLPFSRTEFYTQAVDVLLQQLKGQLNTYRVAPKLLILEQLALFNQERGVNNQSDRLSLDERTVISQINLSLPSLNLEPKDAVPLLKEIVERSGLLLEIDGGTRYQFSHLTLQEYFAASALRGDGDKLSQFYVNDPDAWRETVKLWCGLPHDSTKLIETINELDPVTAFDCLADTQKIEHTMVDRLIKSFKPKLYEVNGDNDAVIRAFASVASGPSQRSQAVFTFLMDAFDSAKDDVEREQAAAALSLTNKPAAVQRLAAHASNSRILASLARMGDLAANALTKQAQGGDLSALTALNAIGTPKAAANMAPLLWNENRHISRLSAFYLASLFRQSGTVETLRDCKLPIKETESGWERFVWKPFNEPPDSPVPVIAGRIAFLLNNDPLSSPLPQSELDRRIIIPLIVSHFERTRGYPPPPETLFTNEEIRAVQAFVRSERVPVAPFRNVAPTPTGKIDERVIPLFGLLDPITRFILSRQLFHSPRAVTIKHWVNVLRPSEYDFSKSRLFVGMLIVAGIFSLISVAEAFIWIGRSTSLISWGNLIAVLMLILLGISWPRLLRRRHYPFYVKRFGAILSAKEDIQNANMLSDNDWTSQGENVLSIVWYFYTLCLTPSVLFFASSFMYRFLSPPYILGVWICAFSILGFLRWQGIKREREVLNPVAGILDVSQNNIAKFSSTLSAQSITIRLQVT
jgi:hypothetical protein